MHILDAIKLTAAIRSLVSEECRGAAEEMVSAQSDPAEIKLVLALPGRVSVNHRGEIVFASDEHRRIAEALEHGTRFVPQRSLLTKANDRLCQLADADMSAMFKR